MEATRPVWVAVGSNIEPERSITGALDALKGVLRIQSVSTFYRTPALDRPGQPDFFNGAFLGESAADPRRLKWELLRPLEQRLGRLREADKYAPRTIDLDLVLCGNLVVDEEGLVLPDPEIRIRAFLAVPLLDLTPDLVMPDTGVRLVEEVPQAWRLELAAESGFSELLRERLIS